MTVTEPSQHLVTVMLLLGAAFVVGSSLVLLYSGHKRDQRRRK